MRTKTLLVAAAALAVTAIASQAQTTVYSQNIVGYVNQTLPQGNYTLVVTPLQGGETNADQVLTSLKGGESILLWNGAGYDSYVYAGPGTWIGPSGPGSGPVLNAGQAFFFFNNQSSAETNTYTGSVTLTNSVDFPAGEYSLVGSIAPIAGPIDSTNINLPVQGGESVLLWNGNGYDSYVYAGPGTWIGPSGPGPAPSVTVGQGFFYFNNQGTDEQWNQNVVVQ